MDIDIEECDRLTRSHCDVSYSAFVFLLLRRRPNFTLEFLKGFHFEAEGETIERYIVPEFSSVSIEDNIGGLNEALT